MCRNQVFGLVFGLIFAALSTAAWAGPPVSRIRIQVTDAQGQPTDARVSVRRFGTFNNTTVTPLPEGRHASLESKAEEAWNQVTPVRSGEWQHTGNDGRLDVTADKDGHPLQPGIYVIDVTVVDSNDHHWTGRRIVYIGAGTSPTFSFASGQMHPIYGAQLTADTAIAQGAVEEGDKATYDAARASAEARVAEESQDLSELDAAMRAFRQANGIPAFRSPRQVRDAINTAKGLGTSVDQTKIDALETYEDMLRFRGFQKAVEQEAQKKFREEFPAWPTAGEHPEGTKTSMAAPEGTRPGGPRVGTGTTMGGETGVAFRSTVPQFNVVLTTGANTIDRPSVKLGRFELGMGVEIEGPAYSFDTEDTDVAFGLSAGTSFGMFGVTGIYGELRADYFKSDVKETVDEITPPAGWKISLFSPDGAYDLGDDNTLTGVKFDSSYEAYSLGYRTWKWLDAYPDLQVAPVVSLDVGQIASRDKVWAGVFKPSTGMMLADFWQVTDVTSTTVSPGIGAKVRYGLGDLGTDAHVFLFGELAAAAQYNTADGDWSTEVAPIDTEVQHQAFSRSGFTFAGSAGGGIGFESRGLTVKAEMRYDRSGNTPVIRYADPRSTVDGTGGAELDFKDREEYFAGISVQASF
jgi:hypothetical protein